MTPTNQVMMTALAGDAATDQGVAGWAIDMMEKLGAPGAGLAVALENLFPPLPSEVILPLAGFAANRGDLGLFSAILFTTLGSVVGALALYGVGAVLGRDRTRALAGRLPLVKVEDVDKAEDWFDRHGPKAVLIGRLRARGAQPDLGAGRGGADGGAAVPRADGARQPGLELGADHRRAIRWERSGTWSSRRSASCSGSCWPRAVAAVDWFVVVKAEGQAFTG